MPLVTVTLLEGRTLEQKKAMLTAITQAIHDSIGAPIDAIRIGINEVPRDHFMAGGVLASERETVAR